MKPQLRRAVGDRRDTNDRGESMGIRDWPASERPREKLLARGAGALSDAELLAIFLRTCVAGTSAVDLARQMLVEYGSLDALLAADLKRFSATRWLGTAKFAQLQAVLEMARRRAGEAFMSRDVLSDPQATRAYLSMHMARSEHEIFACLFLDNRNRVIVFEELLHDTYASAPQRSILK